VTVGRVLPGTQANQPGDLVEVTVGGEHREAATPAELREQRVDRAKL
jgi:hypothetical protein